MNHNGSDAKNVTIENINVTYLIAFSCALSIKSSARNPNSGKNKGNNSKPAESVCGMLYSVELTKDEHKCTNAHELLA
jgi:hypothetical protein